MCGQRLHVTVSPQYPERPCAHRLPDCPWHPRTLRSPSNCTSTCPLGTASKFRCTVFCNPSTTIVTSTPAVVPARRLVEQVAQVLQSQPSTTERLLVTLSPSQPYEHRASATPPAHTRCPRSEFWYLAAATACQWSDGLVKGGGGARAVHLPRLRMPCQCCHSAECFLRSAT